MACPAAVTSLCSRSSVSRVFQGEKFFCLLVAIFDVNHSSNGGRFGGYGRPVVRAVAIYVQGGCIWGVGSEIAGLANGNRLDSDDCRWNNGLFLSHIASARSPLRIASISAGYIRPPTLIEVRAPPGTSQTRGCAMLGILKFGTVPSVFDPEMIWVMASALDEAWNRIEKSGSRFARPGHARAGCAWWLQTESLKLRDRVSMIQPSSLMTRCVFFYQLHGWLRRRTDGPAFITSRA
jgi:hypothetical protein